VPRSALIKIHALYGTDFSLLPARLPRGEVYLWWKTGQGGSPQYLLPWLSVSWARNGHQLTWDVSDGRLPAGGICDGANRRPLPLERVFHRNGHLVVWTTGNKLAEIETCYRVRSRGDIYPLDVMLSVQPGPGAPPLQDLIRALTTARRF
jgi:hypothetical protein